MSNINSRNPKSPTSFAPLNQRKQGTVGQTHGERRQHKVEKGLLAQCVQGIKDVFSGGRNTKNINDFSNSADKYVGTHSANPILDAHRRRETGNRPNRYADHQGGHIQFLNQILQTPTPPKKTKS